MLLKKQVTSVFLPTLSSTSYKIMIIQTLNKLFVFIQNLISYKIYLEKALEGFRNLALTDVLACGRQNHWAMIFASPTN